MMQQLIDTRHTRQCPLVILHDGRIRTFEGHGVRRLYNILNNEPELLYGSKIAVQAAGQTAARMMADGGVAEVWADMLSEQAYHTLNDAGIVVKYKRKVDHTTFLDLWRRLGETAL